MKTTAAYDIGYLASDFGMHDRNDCVIRAIANIGVMSYPEASKALAERGRKSKRGTACSTTDKFYRSLGATLKIYGNGSRRHNLKNWVSPDTEYPKGVSVGKLLPQLSNGRHIVWVRKHVFAVVNGRVIDTCSVPNGKHVLGVYSFND